MKRILTFIMAIVLVFASVIPAFAAEKAVTPVILVSGFGATTLAQDGVAVFPPSLDKIVEALGFGGDITPEKAEEQLSVWLQDEGYVEQISRIVKNIVEPCRMNPDGTATYELEPIIYGAENTSLADFKEKDMLSYVPYTGSEFLDMESIGQRIGDENVFNFTYDWRKDYDIIADEFKAYIDDVLEITGAEKVSVYSISQGSVIVGQYLYKYAHLKQTDNVVFDTPVLGGTTFVADLLRGEDIRLNFYVVLQLLSDILHMELDLTFLEGILDNDFIAGAVNIGLHDCLTPPLKGCIAFWQLVPIAEFDECADALLDKEENAEVIKAVRRLHREFMGNITETFEKATSYGSDISIKATTGFDLVTPSNEYSDCIVDMQYSCGAICAPYGESFPADYKQAVKNGKNSISPDRTIDLSAGYWPDRTWVIDGLFHGQAEWCPKSLALLEELLYTDNLKDAYSSYEFPQFMQAESPTATVSTHFVNTNSNFLLLEDGREEYTFVVKNTSKSKTLLIKDVECSNDAVDVDFRIARALLPGESLNVTVSADAAKSGVITVSYSEASVHKTVEKDFGITVLETYSGATVNDKMPENSVLPASLRYIINVIKDLFNKIVSLFGF